MISANGCMGTALIAAACVAVAGCASAPPPPPKMLSMTIHALPALNPDARGRPTPVLLRIYELRARDAFDRATFFELYDHDARVLGNAVLERAEIAVSPGETVPFVRPLDPATRAVAIMAAYERIDEAKWRASVMLGSPPAAELIATLDSSTVRLTGTTTVRAEPERGFVARWVHPVWKAVTNLFEGAK